MPPRTRTQRRLQPSDDDPVPPSEDGEEVEDVVLDSEQNVFIDEEDENDENTPINDENTRPLPPLSFAPRSSTLRTPMSHAFLSEDLVLRDITDQFIYPPSPSPIRISKNTLKRPAQSSIEPPRRPKKPKAQAYPADPPNWVHTAPSSSSLPPSSPLPTSTIAYDNGRVADRTHDHTSSARYEYELMSAPIRTLDSDPFGFLAVERALKAKRATTPVPAPPVRKPARRLSTVVVRSPPRNVVLLSNTPTAPISSTRPDAPIPTNDEGIDDLYLDEPVAGPSSRPLVPSAPLLGQQSVQKANAEMFGSPSQVPVADPLRTPRKRRRTASPVPEDSPDEESLPSSPSPVKVSVGTVIGPRVAGRVKLQSKKQEPLSTMVPENHTRALSAKAKGKQPIGKESHKVSAAPKRLKAAKHTYIPTPSSTPPIHRRSFIEASSPSVVNSPIPPKRRSARQAAASKHPVRDLGSECAEDSNVGRTKIRLRSTRSTTESKSKPSPIRKPNTRSGTRAKAAAPKNVEPPSRTTRSSAKSGTTTRRRGNPKTVAGTKKGTKGKRKGGPLEDVLGMSDDTREVGGLVSLGSYDG
ncbi:hypothetical protein ID866_9625 [Astraeus odoratus]|nr:hypothetical protein ID866_9625 [Astraeus odoratus]